jgi:membrane-associated sensor protein
MFGYVTTDATGNLKSRYSSAQRVTIVIICFYAAFAIALIPFAPLPGPVIPGFVALFVSGILISELSTSFLLFVRARDTHPWPLLLLGCAYLYSGLMSVSQLLTFPGAVLSGEALITTSEQAAAWIFTAWVNGFALLTFISVVVEARLDEQQVAPKNFGATIAAAVCVIVLLSAAAVFFAVTMTDHLPPLVSQGRFTPASWIARSVGFLLSCVSIVVILFVIRERSRLYLWLSIALTAVVFHNVLSTFGGARFTIGWSVGRLSWLVSAVALLVYFLGQFARQQNLLVRTSEILEQHAEAQTAELGGSGAQYPRNMDATIERFLARENILRYRAMLQLPRDNSHREVISRLLSEEESKLKRLSDRSGT